ncbi:hypothetical protein GH714_031039 [Hevea brasiliensis]|uniref:Ultraviolet-B receptor UVR8 n=1 Tax=Hevea brasiliensis TaxID=3981 RepID=A0A6A6LSJ9_HEVBR|nr:hypothetical protein GH714_031039 [Hevea brasiliensis]
MDDALRSSSNLSRKVVSVAAGEAHTLALTGDGCVYSWGRGMFGRLGIGSEVDALLPVQVKCDTCSESEEKRLKLVGIAAGAYHSMALAVFHACQDFVIYVLVNVCILCNLNLCMDGQLGVNGENAVVPRMMEHFLGLTSFDSVTKSETKREAPLKACSVKAGGMMSLAIDNLGTLWIWGNCPQQSSSSGESGFSLVSSFTPIPVWDFHGHTVVKVACGNEHVVCCSVSVGETYEGEDLVCYSWGNNNHGQLGLGDRESRIHPEIVETFNQHSPWAIYEVACGAFHTALLTHKKRPNEKLESTCWTFGLGENGQLGHGTSQSALKPEPVNELPLDAYLVSVDCGLFHTSVVSSAGDVWSWGMEKGLGLCPDARFTGTDAGDALSPLRITGPQEPRFHDPVQVTIDFFAPTAVMWPPLADDFKDQGLNNVTKDDNLESKGSEEVAEIEKRLSSAMEEMKLLQSKFSIMERYAGILHGSIFGKPFTEEDIPSSLRDSGTFDIAKEWEDMLESADRSKLIRLELLYRNMLSGVKDKHMKRRIQEIIKECVPSTPGK